MAALLLLLVFPSTCLLPTKADKDNPTLAGVLNRGRAMADVAAPAQTDRGADLGKETRVIKPVTVLNPVVDRELEAKAVVAKILQLKDLIAEGATEAELHKRHHLVASATDGKRTVSVPDTTKRSANISTLAAPLLPSL